MLKCLHLLAIVGLLSTATLRAQWITDIPPTGEQNYLPVEGGGYKMIPDTITSLDTLIHRLYGQWDYIETGKGYWIGYTEDMFSIAAHGDKAIEPLMNIIRNAKDHRARIGALNTLHLIGIDRRVAGRFYEEFFNPKARLAMLQLVRDSILRKDVLQLLVRDPWLSDISYLMDILRESITDDVFLVNAFKLYPMNEGPFQQYYSKRVGDIKMHLRAIKKDTPKSQRNYDAQVKASLKLLDKDPCIEVLPEVYITSLYKPGEELQSKDIDVPLWIFLTSSNAFVYCDVDDHILQYYVEDDKLIFCTIQTVKTRLLNWWDSLPDDKKAQYARLNWVSVPVEK